MIALIDGDHLARRSFHALEHYTGTEGQPAGTVYGFLNSLKAICFQLVPYFVVICWGDRRSRLWRREVFPEYKANRSPTPQDFTNQVLILQELLEGLGLCQVLCPSFEADDLIAAISSDCVVGGREVGIVTGDHDLFQLIKEDHPTIYGYKSVKGKGYVKVSSKDVEDKFGVPPALLPMFMAMKGERGDGVPGIPGIGPKRAAEYLQGQASSSVRKKIKAHGSIIERNLRLVDLRNISSKDLTPSRLKVMPRDYDEVKVLGILRKIGLTGSHSILPEVRSMIEFYQETQRRGAHSIADLTKEM